MFNANYATKITLFYIYCIRYTIYILLMFMNWFFRIVFWKFPFPQECSKNSLDNHFPFLSFLVVILSRHMTDATLGITMRTSRCQETSQVFPHHSIDIYLPRNYTAMCNRANGIIWPKVHARAGIFYLHSIPHKHKHAVRSWYPRYRIRWYETIFFFFNTRESSFLVFFIFNTFS